MHNAKLRGKKTENTPFFNGIFRGTKCGKLKKQGKGCAHPA